MIWLIFGGVALCGSVLTALRDTPAQGDRAFVDRAPIRRAGGVLLGLSATFLLGWFTLTVLAHWVASDL